MCTAHMFLKISYPHHLTIQAKAITKTNPEQHLQPSSMSGILAKPARPETIMAAEAAVLLPGNGNYV